MTMRTFLLFICLLLSLTGRGIGSLTTYVLILLGIFYLTDVSSISLRFRQRTASKRLP
jgi:hypothetical protein